MAAHSKSEIGAFHTALWWIKRDVRLDDNPALTAALRSSKYVIPVAIYEPDV